MGSRLTNSSSNAAIPTALRRLPPYVLFLLPWALIYASFYLFPFLFSFILSFLRYNPLGTRGASLVGLENFARLFHDEYFLQALRNTLFFVVCTVPLTTGVSLFLALLLQGKVRGKGVFRAGFFVPSILSMVVVSLLFKLFYSPGGALNGILSLLGIEGRGWLTDPRTALPSIMVMDIWAAVGYYAVIFYAALESIPRELYEMAELEGASKLGAVRHISLPLMKPAISLVLVINTIRSFQIFIEVFVMTQGGPLGSTNTLVLYLYETAFRRLDYGYASAVAYVVFILSGIFSVIAIRRMRPGTPSLTG